MRRDFFTKAKAWTIIALICVILASFSACDGTASDIFAYSEEDFSAVVEGSVDGIEIKAVVHFEKEGEDVASRIMTVSYLSPKSLEGLTVSLYSDGTSRTRLGNIEFGEGSFGGLAAPFLVICPQGEYSSISHNGAGDAEVVFVNAYGELKYFFKKDVGFPTRIEGRASGRYISIRLSEKNKNKLK